MRDGLGRSIDYLRISITDRCDLRCVYCMPAAGVPALEHAEILRYEEILRLVRILAPLGVKHLRLTGGEPMTRRGCLDLIRELRKVPGVESVAMTSNGILLADQIGEAKAAGLTALNLSLDTLNPDTYRRLTRGGDVGTVLRTLSRAAEAGIQTKLNAIPLRGVNVEELPSLAALARENPICVRFIELMPLGCARDLTPVPTVEVMEHLEAAYGPLCPDDAVRGHGPAVYVRPEGFQGSLGFISALSHEFCGHCNRVRLTADGSFKLCLNHTKGTDLRALLRSGASDGEVEAAIRSALAEKPARHNFREALADREARRMNEIGG
ncbi:MAG: GTP 3',8-cyclase MoaA [Oscillospiraceae bacterium]|nr:GTP 3',8-cyclase MoaA [Oscillospiraceae bacterium]